MQYKDNMRGVLLTHESISVYSPVGKIRGKYLHGGADPVSAIAEAVGAVATAAGTITTAATAAKTEKQKNKGKTLDFITAKEAAKAGATQSASATQIAAKNSKTIITVSAIFAGVIVLGVGAWFLLSEQKLSAPSSPPAA